MGVVGIMTLKYEDKPFKDFGCEQCHRLLESEELADKHFEETGHNEMIGRLYIKRVYKDE